MSTPHGTAPEVVVADTPDQLAADTAERTISVLADAIGARGRAHLIITGGGILEQVLAALVRPEGLDWSQVHVWWGDERYVPADSDDRNDRPAMAKFLDLVPVDPAKVHRMPSSDAGFAVGDVDTAGSDAAGSDAADSDAADSDGAQAAAESYAADLAIAADGQGPTPDFDVALIGIGPDGHCCSLFPRHPGALTRDTAVIAVHDSPKPPPVRLSLTVAALDAVRQLWFVASGDGKADAVARALGGADPVDVPAAAPRGSEATVWLLDAEAASHLAT